MYTRKDIQRMVEGELNRISDAKEKLQSAREAEAIEASRKRLAKRAVEAGRKQATATRERRVRPAITSYTRRDGRVEILDPEHPELWSAEARSVEAQWAAIDRTRKSSRGYIISAPCSEAVKVR